MNRFRNIVVSLCGVVGTTLCVPCELRADPLPICGVPWPIDPVLQSQLDAHCQARTAMFGDTIDPGLCFKLESPITKPGEYPCLTWLEEEGKFEASYVVRVNLKPHAPDLYMQGTEIYACYGTISGPSGSIPVQGVSITDFPGATGTSFTIGGVLTTAQLADYANAARLESGVRVVDSNTGQSIPLSQLTGNANLYASPSDLSTLYNTGEQDGIDSDCVKLAYKRYNIAVKAAQDTNSGCVAAAMVRFSACMSLICIPSAFIPGPWTPLLTVGCSLGCLVVQVADMGECTNSYGVAMRAAYENLLLDLEACGVRILFM